MTWRRQGMGVMFHKSYPTHAVAQQIENALLQPPPRTEQERQQLSDRMTSAAMAQTTMSFNWRGFLLAVGLFGALLAVAILVDMENMVDDPTVYSGFASTALGAVLGYLTGEAVGTATG